MLRTATQDSTVDQLVASQSFVEWMPQGEAASQPAPFWFGTVVQRDRTRPGNVLVVTGHGARRVFTVPAEHLEAVDDIGGRADAA